MASFNDLVNRGVRVGVMVRLYHQSSPNEHQSYSGSRQEERSMPIGYVSTINTKQITLSNLSPVDGWLPNLLFGRNIRYNLHRISDIEVLSED